MKALSLSTPNHRLILLLLASLGTASLSAQQAVSLPSFHASTRSAGQEFKFVTDGPQGPGWTRPDEIARAYFPESLPAFFQRTVELQSPLPAQTSMEWIFTGPRAGFTVTLTSGTVRVVERYYNSAGLSEESGSYPSRTTRNELRSYTGGARSLTVILDAHLGLTVQLNGQTILTEPCLFDVTRHQLRVNAPRTHHEVVTGRLLHEAPVEATLTVSPENKHQTMLGFGGSPSIPAYRSLSEEGQRRYWDILRRYNLLIDRAYPMGTELKRDLSNIDHLSDATPHYYGDNFPNGEVSDFDYSRHTIDLGGFVIYEMWALPKWATVPWKPADGAAAPLDAWNKPVRTAADPEIYASIVVGYCRMLQQRSGAAPLIVGIENEVEQPPEVFAQMTITLRRELDKAGFHSTQIHQADAPYIWMAVDRTKALRTDEGAWKDTDYITAHQYDYQLFLANPDFYDERLRELHTVSALKAFLATEICLNDPNAQEPSYRLAFQVGQLYHKDLTLLDAEALMYCWLILDVEQPTFGSSRALLVPDRTNGDVPMPSSFQLRVLGAWSRHIRRGMTRVDVRSSDPDLMSTAFQGEGQATLIVMNRGTEARRLSVAWSGVPAWKQAERTSLYSPNNAEAAPSGTITLAPGEIITLTTEAAQ